MRYLSLFLVLIATFAAAQPESVTSVLDQFDRAGPSMGANWSDDINGGSGGCEIYTEEAFEKAAGGGGGCWWNASTFDADQEVFSTLADADTYSDTERVHPGVLCLHDGVGTPTVNGYAVSFQKRTAAADRLVIRKITNGSFSDIGSFHNLEMGSGDKVSLRHDTTGGATVLTVYVDQGSGWTSAFSRDSTTYPSDIVYNCANTNIGVFITNQTHNLDDFGGGNWGAAPPSSATGVGGFFQFQ